jgi:hypothetical protein
MTWEVPSLRPSDQRSTDRIRSRRRARRRERADATDRRGQGVSEPGRADQSGPAARARVRGERGERSDLDWRAEIRSALIKSKPPDLRQTPEIQRLATGRGWRWRRSVSRRGLAGDEGDDHGEALRVLGIARARSGRSDDPDRGHHAGAGALESAGHGEAG